MRAGENTVPARAKRRLLAAAMTLAAGLLLFACEFIFPVPLQDNAAEGGAHDSAVEMDAPDVRITKDAGKDAGVDGRTNDARIVDSGADVEVYQNLDNSFNWSTFNTAGLNGKAAGFAGGTYDGRYVYLAPYERTVAARFDTTADFTSAGAWSLFDTRPVLDAGADASLGTGNTSAAFFGSVFDGQYVYFVPGVGPAAFAARFDTKQTFTTATSWETFELSTLAGGNAYSFGGGAFDGRYVYMVPNQTPILAQYDTEASFSGAGWSTLDLNTVSHPASDSSVANDSFTGAVFDGRYLYLIPGSFYSVAMRYDTHGALTSPGSWATFDTTKVNSTAYGFAGGAFDGRYVYLVPNDNGLVVRYDTTAGVFGSSASWSFFNTVVVKPKARAYFGGGFDGRYVYFVPNGDPIYYYSSSGLAVRYDTTQSFFAPTSWSTFNIAMLANASGFMGAVFDGEHMYFVPNDNGAVDGIVARFEARTPPLMPSLPDFHGSFF